MSVSQLIGGCVIVTDRISRRAVLQSLTAAGLVGAATGAGAAGTRAFLTDVESVHATAAAGTLDLALAATTGSGTSLDATDFESTGTVSVPIVGSGRGQSSVGISVCGATAYVWLRPRSGDAWDASVAQDLELTITSYQHCGRGDGHLVYSGSIDRLVEAFSSAGVRLDGGTNDECLSPGCIDEGDYCCLTFEWTYDGKTGGTLSLSLEFFAAQCRHGTDSSPWRYGDG